MGKLFFQNEGSRKVGRHRCTLWQNIVLYHIILYYKWMFMHLFPTEEPMSCWEWWTRCTLWIPLWEKHWEELLVRINIKHHLKHGFTWSSYYITQNNTLKRKVPLLIRLKQFQSFQTRIFLTLCQAVTLSDPRLWLSFWDSGLVRTSSQTPSLLLWWDVPTVLWKCCWHPMKSLSPWQLKPWGRTGGGALWYL